MTRDPHLAPTETLAIQRRESSPNHNSQPLGFCLPSLSVKYADTLEGESNNAGLVLKLDQITDMRRPGYGDSSGNAYVTSQLQRMSGQRMEHKSGHYQGRPELLASEKEHPYGASKPEGQWRWQRDESKVPNAMSSHMFNEGHAVDESRSYYEGQRQDPKLALEKQGNNETRSHPLEEDMNIGYEDNPLSQTYEGLEQRFVDDIMKLSKEQADAEDAENARHREKINTINAQYQEQLAALRARYTNRRDEFIRRESHARQQQYQQAMMDQYSGGIGGPSEVRGYGGAGAAAGEPHRAYNADRYDTYRERARFIGGTRDHEFESRGGPYPGGRVYNAGGSRYY
ncbi:uncharacterized protein LOC127797617 [Diospyros lotus]|uniref:uncharacterized protein LOC127797617 n=1 Tax=Diospyros lotus TaxID=55363 RepID=UPI0022585683|nr:uncharacterized protein LOC127797617 [Diospyros lotus]